MCAQPSEASADQAAASDCRHCGQVLVDGQEAFCCSGCRIVYTLLHEGGFERFYELRGASGAPVPESRKYDVKWLEPEQVRIDALATDRALLRLDFDLQGLHCAGCVWLIDQLMARDAHGVSVLVNPALGNVQLWVRRGFSLASFARELGRFGYRLGPRRKAQASASSDLLLRMGICIAIAMNAMILAISVYAGLEDGALRRVFDTLSFALATLSVAVGATPFLTSAWHGVRRRLLHLDLPIGLGIVLAYTGSAWAYFAHRPGTYFDTLDVFIALMLVGRFVQNRVLERNRHYLLQGEGLDGLWVRRCERDEAGAATKPTVIRAMDVQQGDLLLLTPGDLLPVSATLAAQQGDVVEEEAAFALDWISGESEPRGFAVGSSVPAGAFNAGDRPLLLVAEEAFSRSALVSLLSATPSEDRAQGSRIYRLFAKRWVLAVLLLSLGGFLLHLLRSGDVPAALDVVVSLLIVTCPCAFGIAVPTAYEIAQAGLRREGLFIRTPTFLDRVAAVRRIVFDKTGTLTTGRLRIDNPAALEALDDAQRRVLFQLASASGHPKACAVTQELLRIAPGLHLDGAIRPREIPSRGIEVSIDSVTYRLGAPGWAAEPTSEPCDLLFAVDGRVLAALHTSEQLRPNAAEELRALERAGYEVWILSGDLVARVERMAAAVGLPLQRALGGRSPEDKAAWLRATDRADTLFIGDGINDSLAAAMAHCSGTPAVDRPQLAARSDFFFLTPGLGPIRRALVWSRRLAVTVRLLLFIALAYNLVTVSLALAGWMTPLWCAVLMPLSSVTTLLASLSVRLETGDEGPANRGATARANLALPAISRGSL